MSAIPSTIVNQATLIHGRQISVPGRTFLPNWRSCVRESKRALSEENIAIVAREPFLTPEPVVPYCSEMRKVVATWSRHTRRPPMCLPGEEELSTEEARRHIGWQPRAELFATAMGTGETFNGILALSIEPTDPSIDQLLYYGYGCVDNPRAATHTLADVSEDFSCRRVAPSDPRAPTLRGFLRPFDHFSSRMFSPEYRVLLSEIDPHLPSVASDELCTVPDCASTKKTIDSYLNEIKPSDLRDRIAKIIRAFLADDHCAKILITAMPSFGTPDATLKQKCFKKW